MQESSFANSSFYGWVRRKGRSGLWYKRFATLDGDILNLFKDENRSTLDKSFKMDSNAEITVISPIRFAIKNLEDPTDILTINCTNSDEATRWITALKGAAMPTPSLSMEDFKILSVIGRGYYGKVMLVNKIGTNELYAIKSVHKRLLVESGNTNQILAERNFLMRAKHPFLVSLYFTFQTESKFYLGLEYVPGGNLRFHTHNISTYPIPDAKLYTAEIGSAISYLHSIGIIYRDLKTENVLLDSEGHVKLVDFGLAADATQVKTAHSFCGTPEYLAPEIIQHKDYSFNVDEWSLGILMCELFFGEHPFYDSNQHVMYQKIIESKPAIPDYCDEELRDVINQLLTKDPQQRPSFVQLKCHRFFLDIDWEKLLKREIKPVYVPTTQDPLDLSHFDSCFTNESAADSFVQPAFGDISNVQGFSYYKNEL